MPKVLRKFALALAAMVSLAVSGCGNPAADPIGPDRGPRVAVTIAPQAWLVKQIGGDRVEAVETVVKAGESPHSYQPSDSQVTQVMRSDLYFRIGVPAEQGAWFDAIRSIGDIEIVDGRQGIELREMPVRHHAHNDTSAGSQTSADSSSHGDACEHEECEHEECEHSDHDHGDHAREECDHEHCEHSECGHDDPGECDHEACEHPECEGHHDGHQKEHNQGDQKDQADTVESKTLVSHGESHDHEEGGAHGQEHGHQHHHGHKHHACGGCSIDGKDPHIWTSPRLLKTQAATVADALAKVDPSHADYYQDNLVKLTARLDELDSEMRGQLAMHQGKAFFVFHPAWGYLADEYQLRQIAVEVQGKEPTDKELTEFQTLARKEGTRTVFVQPQIGSGSAGAIAKAVGGRVEQLDPLADDVLENLRNVAQKIASSFEVAVARAE